MTLEAVRTPDDRFASLPDWSYEPTCVDDPEEYEGLQMHFVQEWGEHVARASLAEWERE